MNMPIPSLLLAGGTAGAAAWVCSYPLDVIKTRLQTDPLPGETPRYKGLIDCAMKSHKEAGGGLKGFMVFTKGLTTAVVRSFPVNAAIFGSYELLIYLMNRDQH